MPLYLYTGRDQQGKQVRGRVEANSEREAANLIREYKVFITDLKVLKKNSLPFSFSSLQKIGFREVVNITRQLATMVTAGLQIPDALNLLRNQTSNHLVADMLNKIYQDIESGGNLANALVKFPKQFSPSYIALIRAGESSGTLDRVLTRLADNLDKDLEFRNRIRGALVYPAIIVSTLLVVFVILMVAVVPRLTQLYADFGADLPLPTRILQGISDFSVSFWWLIALVAFFGSQMFKRWKKTPVGRRTWDRFILNLPIFGNLQKQIVLVEFTRTLGLLVGAGVSILDALRILTDSVSNIHYQETFKEINQKVEKGMSMASLFSQYTLFPPILAQMIKVGEETGKLDESLVRLSTYFESESDTTVKALTTIIEPLIMVVLGVGVGFIVFSIITPIYNLTSQFK